MPHNIAFFFSFLKKKGARVEIIFVSVNNFSYPIYTKSTTSRLRFNLKYKEYWT